MIEGNIQSPAFANVVKYRIASLDNHIPKYDFVGTLGHMGLRGVQPRFDQVREIGGTLHSGYNESENARYGRATVVPHLMHLWYYRNISQTDLIEDVPR